MDEAVKVDDGARYFSCAGGRVGEALGLQGAEPTLVDNVVVLLHHKHPGKDVHNLDNRAGTEHQGVRAGVQTLERVELRHTHLLFPLWLLVQTSFLQAARSVSSQFR